MQKHKCNNLLERPPPPPPKNTVDTDYDQTLTSCLSQVYGVCCTTPSSDEGNSKDNGNSYESMVAMPVNPYTGQPNNGPSNYHLWFQITASNIKTPIANPDDGESNSKQSTQCGAGPTKMLSYDEQRIVGGSNAVKNSWPSIVSYVYTLI